MQSLTGRRIALVCMTPVIDGGELSAVELPSYGIRRIHAALFARPELAGALVELVDLRAPDVERYVDALEAFAPDLVGVSVYVWSFPVMVEVARRLKKRRPETIVVFGGPSARPAMFAHAEYGNAHEAVDALVTREGEMTFADLACRPVLSRATLGDVDGLTLARPGGWTETRERPPLIALDVIASPFQMDLMPTGAVGYLETYRGCPMSCAFCEWGVDAGPNSIFSREYLVEELVALTRARAPAAFLVDAGLNLNARAFRNLKAAEAEVGFFRDAFLWCEVYPTHFTPEHTEFLSSIATSYCGIGLQSIDPEVLRQLDRPFDPRRFASVVHHLAGLARCEIQIIMALPGDTPDGFRRTLDYARSLGVAVRAYHCLVLPDALMTRSRPEWDVRYDPVTLELLSCAGWPRDAVLGMRAELDAQAAASGGSAGRFWWHFEPGRPA